MIAGHVYQKLTSIRSPRFKRESFDRQFELILNAEFEGGRPERWIMRDMAWRKARKEAMEMRASMSPAIKR